MHAILPRGNHRQKHLLTKANAAVGDPHPVGKGKGNSDPEAENRGPRTSRNGNGQGILTLACRCLAPGARFKMST